MHVCFFNRSYWPDQAATGQLLTELAEDLVARHGCRVTVVAGRSLHAADGHDERRPSRWPVTRRRTRACASCARTASRFRPRRFAGRAANYVSYFASAALASLRADRPDVVVSLTDPPIIGLVARWTARRLGARFVFLCEDMFPEVAALLEDFHNPLSTARSTGPTGICCARRMPSSRSATACGAPRGGKGRRPGANARDPQLGRLRSDRARRQGQRLCASARSRRSLRADALGNVGMSQNLDALIGAADRLRSLERLVILIVGQGAKRETLQREADGAG